jgi:hypothetical protein
MAWEGPAHGHGRGRSGRRANQSANGLAGDLEEIAHGFPPYVNEVRFDVAGSCAAGKLKSLPEDAYKGFSVPRHVVDLLCSSRLVKQLAGATRDSAVSVNCSNEDSHTALAFLGLHHSVLLGADGVPKKLETLLGIIEGLRGFNR